MEKAQRDDRTKVAAAPLRDGMEAKAAQAVLNGTNWLTAQTVGKRESAGASTEAADQWQAEGKVFAIEWAGETLYPGYVFDVLGNPIPEMVEILKVFKGYTPLRIASWFESTNSMLHGKRPREVIASAPSAVLEAARDHVAGQVHG
ncbi:hypothetical protein AB3X94_20875 [Paraburkholderia sp. BR10923]|uniref:hypothetical protein n=1 Tax=Paraburkholderia sp. BR10923 TaxID=3236992 RepID=UPI0034D004BA